MDTPPTTPTAASGASPPPNGGQTPGKYIRTFEGDIEAFKKGRIPNFAPLKESPTPSQNPVPPPAPVPVETPEPPPGSPQGGLPAEFSANETAAAKPEPPESPLKTYAGDFSQRMQETHASRATVLAAQQDALSGAPHAVLEKSPDRGNMLYVIAAAVLLLIGAAGAYIAYTRYLASVEPVILAPTPSAPIFVDEREQIPDASSSGVSQAIIQSAARPLALNAVRLLYLDAAAMTERSVFSALQLPVPDILLRNVNAVRSMAGIIHSGSGQSPFFILSVASYRDTFAGMLAWEPTMPRDLEYLFFAQASPTLSPDAASSPQAVTAVSTTSMSSASSPPADPAQATATIAPKTSMKAATSTPSVPTSALAFHDEVVDNHDVRVYRDAEGRTLLYGYWNQETLVIARDPAAFTDILGRLATSRTQN